MLTFQVLLSFGSALLCGGLAVFVYLRNAQSFAHKMFSVGMIAFGLEAVFVGLSVQATLHAEVVRWQYLGLLAAAFLPGTWLLFSLSFARANYQEFVARWQWVVLITFLCPLSLVVVFSHGLSVSPPAMSGSARWVLSIGWAGTAFFVFFLLSAVLILMNLERTLRASVGSMRWRIKFMLLGLGGLFAVRIYTASQTLLFASVDTGLEVINNGALIVADSLIIFSLIRARFLDADVYLSQGFLYNSITILVIGVYLLAVGLLTKAINSLGYSQALPLEAFFVFFALLGLAILLLSDELRYKVKRFVSRNFHRSHYDYRKEWTAFTQRTASLLNTRDLCVAVTNMVSETFGVGGVTIWLLDEIQEHLILGGSTVFSEAQARSLKIAGKAGSVLIRAMREQQEPVDFNRPEAHWSEGGKLTSDSLHEAQIRYCMPLRAGREWLGLLILGDRLTKTSFSLEEYELLQTIADQVAGSLLNLQLSQYLLQLKEMEAFQTVATFFLHDLKNLASMLSLTMQNLPAHYDDPAFRADSLRVIQGSVTKINTMCSRLSLLTKTLELQRTEVDLPSLVRATLADLNGAVQTTLACHLLPVPRLSLDQEQMQKVIVNLVLNASEAAGPGGKILVATAQRNDTVVLSVSDNGCGMSPEFIEQSLFRPFLTTKSKGMGIGLFHSRKIVETHQGRIEVESEEGKGSTFRVVLPLNP